jgi:hypothetical protein
MNIAAPAPAFMTTRQLQVAVATTSYCQARCQECVWPYMDKSNHVMTQAEFELLLTRFRGFEIQEFAFNVINEPFVDKHIVKKLRSYVSSNIVTNSLFFSSNWLIPSESQIADFVSAIEDAVVCDHVKTISLNATISGIDQKTYDLLQGGALLENTKAPYRSLDFRAAVTNVIRLIALLEERRLFNRKAVLRIKAYGDAFRLQEMEEFWDRQLSAAGIRRPLATRHVRILLNHGSTTFARFEPRRFSRGRCVSGWLDTRLVIGPTGDVGLCCEDGLRSIIVGNLLHQDMNSLVSSQAFREQLEITAAKRDAPYGHPCRRCQFFERI